MKTDKITLIGLGKLGLPLLTTFAFSGQKILGIDIDQEKINNLKDKKLPFYEPNLEEYLEKSFSNIEVSSDFSKAVEETDVAIILVNTPSNERGEFSNEYIFSAVGEISKELKNSQKEDFLFIISSTVMPETHEEIIGKIERISGRTLNNGFGMAHVPDLVALGSVIKDFENPDLVILGESDEKYGDLVESIYEKIIKNNAPFIRMSLLESEITKVSLNAYITMKISFANFIGNIADKYGCDPHNITKALGYDKRISPYYIKSGLSFGGTCFPRDTWAFIRMSENIGLDALHIKATQTINELQNKILFNKVSIYDDKKIGIVGLSFKPDTSVTTESAGYFLYNELKKGGYDVVGFDPLVNTDHMVNLQEFVDICDALVIIHNDKDLYKNIIFGNKILVDPWGLKLS